MDFVLELSHTRTDRESILVVINIFFKKTHLIACKKIEYAISMGHFFF